jgi:hypothetical protein
MLLHIPSVLQLIVGARSRDPHRQPCPFRCFHPCRLVNPLHKRRQRERITAVLDAEDAEQEAVHEEHDCGPDHDHQLLALWVGDSRHLDGQGNDGEGEDTV